MKKIFSLVSILVLLSSVSFAQEVVLYEKEAEYISDSSWDDRDPCGYVLDQLDMVEEVVDIFHEHAEEKIIQRLFQTEDFQSLVRSFTDEFVSSLENTLDVCRDEQTDLYDWNAPMDMMEFERYIQDYVDVLYALSKLENQSGEADIVAEQIVVLQEHIVGDMIDLLSQQGFIAKESIVSFLLDMDDNVEKSMHVVFDLKSNSASDALGTIGEAAIDMSLAVDMEDIETAVDMTIGATITMRIVDEHLYIMLEDLILDIFSGELDDIDMTQIDTFLTQAALLEGKWLDIPLSENLASAGMAYSELLALQQGALQQFFVSPWLMTYHTVGDAVYAGMHPALCATASLFGSVSDCLLYTWLPMYEESDGNGIFVFTSYKDSYSLALTDDYTAEPMPPEIAHLNNYEIISWDTQGIKVIDIPLGEYGIISLDNGSILVDISIPSEEYDWETDMSTIVYTTIDLQGYYRNDALYLVGSIGQGDVLNAEVTIDMEGALDDMHMTLDLLGTAMIDSEAVDIHGVLEIDTSQQQLTSLSVEAPDADDIVDASTFIY